MTLGIGVIGTDIMGAVHVETISTAISGAEVRAIADIEPKRAELIASRVAGAKALTSAESLIESAEVDGVTSPRAMQRMPSMSLPVSPRASQSSVRSHWRRLWQNVRKPGNRRGADRFLSHSAHILRREQSAIEAATYQR